MHCLFRHHAVLTLCLHNLDRPPGADAARRMHAQVFAGSTYHAVASDDNDFNAVLPSWGIREAYVGAANTLASVRALSHVYIIPWGTSAHALAHDNNPCPRTVLRQGAE